MFNRNPPLNKPLVPSSLFTGTSMATPHKTRSQGLSDTDEADRPRRRAARSVSGVSPTKKRKQAVATLPISTVDDDDEEDELAGQGASRPFDQPDSSLPPIGGKADFSYGSAYKTNRDSAAGIDHKDIVADISNLVADKAAESVVVENPVEEIPEESRHASPRAARSTRAGSKTPSKATAKPASKVASKPKTTRSKIARKGVYRHSSSDNVLTA